MAAPESYDRDLKNISRSRMLSLQRPVTSLLTLPGKEMLCVKELRENKTISAETPQVWIERSARRANHLRLQADRQFLSAEVHTTDLDRYVPTRDFDLANLDLEQRFTTRLGMWLEKFLAPRLMPDASVVFTLTNSGQHGPTLDFQTWAARRILANPLLSTWKRRLEDGLGDPRPDFIQSFILASCAFANFDFKLGPVDYYADGAQMHSFRLDHFQRRENAAWVTFSEFITDYIPTIDQRRFLGRKLKEDNIPMTRPARKMKNPTMVAAGYKAAATRRANRAAAIASPVTTNATPTTAPNPRDEYAKLMNVILDCDIEMAAASRRKKAAEDEVAKLRTKLGLGPDN